MKDSAHAAALAACLVVFGAVGAGRGDEGMWLYNNVPAEQLKKKYGFDVGSDWIEHLQKASVRFNSGGSGSFVSADGLVLTNHHVGADALQKLGTKEKNYYRDGFHARSRADELKCEAMELNVLMQIEDVTERVTRAVPAGTPGDKAAALRRAVINTIEKEAKEKTKLQPQVVTLFQGGAYHLYLFKKYTDVRLVFAPEQAIAFFGGDPDNFEYPRYDLDVCFFRVYEDGKPAKIKHYLRWATKPLTEGDLIFVSGHPGRTNRMNTVAELTYLRDVGYPFLMQRLNRLEVVLGAFSARSEENRRQAKELLFSVQNSRKARTGGLAALLDPALMAAKRKEEARLKAKAKADDSLSAARTAWDQIAKAQAVRKEHIRRYTLLEGRAGFFADTFGIARSLVRAAEERAKPNDKRLPEFSDARLETLTEQLFSAEPIYNEFEIVKLTDSLTFLCAELGFTNPLVQKVLAGQSPVERAVTLIRGTQLTDVAVRKKLYEGGQKAIDASDDPMIVLARLVDAASRAERRVIESQVDEVSKQAYGDIAKVKFALDGTKTYPDATFTLRLSFGEVKGYQEAGKKVPFHTTIAGLYERSAEFQNKDPFELPASWIKAKDKLDLKTPFNFVSTADIIGGNSGSPVVNKDGKVIGLIFDSNLHHLVSDFIYEPARARAVSVDARAIIEALTKVYGASSLVEELTR